MTQSGLRSTNFPNVAGQIVALFVPIGDHKKRHIFAATSTFNLLWRQADDAAAEFM